MPDDWTTIDFQICSFEPYLHDELRILTPESKHLASAIAGELRELPTKALLALVADDLVPTSHRVNELKAFQSWMDVAHHLASLHPGVVRAQVITQNYICFVYLEDALFNALRKTMPSESVTGKCAKFLTENPLRAFRNAFAHANWHYMPDCVGLVFWARKKINQATTMARFEVRENELNFWQMLSRTVAYVVFTEIINKSK